MADLREQLLLLRTFLSEVVAPRGATGFHRLFRLRNSPLGLLVEASQHINHFQYMFRTKVQPAPLLMVYSSVMGLWDRIPHDPHYWAPTFFVRPVTLFRIHMWYLYAVDIVESHSQHPYLLDGIQDLCRTSTFLLIALHSTEELPEFFRHLIQEWWCVNFAASDIIDTHYHFEFAESELSTSTDESDSSSSISDNLERRFLL